MVTGFFFFIVISGFSKSKAWYLHWTFKVLHVSNYLPIPTLTTTAAERKITEQRLEWLHIVANFIWAFGIAFSGKLPFPLSTWLLQIVVICLCSQPRVSEVSASASPPHSSMAPSMTESYSEVSQVTMAAGAALLNFRHTNFKTSCSCCLEYSTTTAISIHPKIRSVFIPLKSVPRPVFLTLCNGTAIHLNDWSRNLTF